MFDISSQPARDLASTPTESLPPSRHPPPLKSPADERQTFPVVELPYQTKPSDFREANTWQDLHEFRTNHEVNIQTQAASAGALVRVQISLDGFDWHPEGLIPMQLKRKLKLKPPGDLMSQEAFRQFGHDRKRAPNF